MKEFSPSDEKFILTCTMDGGAVTSTTGAHEAHVLPQKGLGFEEETILGREDNDTLGQAKGVDRGRFFSAGV